MATVGVEVDRFRVRERLVEPIECEADDLEPSFLFGGSLTGCGALLFPHVQDAILDEGMSRRLLKLGGGSVTQFPTSSAFQERVSETATAYAAPGTTISSRRGV